ncbi:MAG: tail fiber domain-containing protein [Candidatus Omnitrophota bacterium]|jgi:hypothetical protein
MPRLLRIVILGLLFLFPVMLLAEEITITSYYPSPYGIYNELRAKKMAIGDDYIDSGDYTWESADGDGGEVDLNADLVVKGNVGIGTTTPGGKLELSRVSANDHWDALRVDNVGSWSQNIGKHANILFTDGSSRVAAIGATYDGYGRLDFHSFYSGGSGSDDNVLMTIRGNGNVGIGTISPSYTLSVAGTIWANGSAIVADATSWSDIRLKEDIKQLNGCLDKIVNLQGLYYHWKKSEFTKNFPKGRQIGIIAQEMEKEFPELVMTDKEGYKSISYDKFTAVLLEAIKEQENKINSQQAVIKSLETKYNFLKSRLDKLERYLEYK